MFFMVGHLGSIRPYPAPFAFNQLGFPTEQIPARNGSTDEADAAPSLTPRRQNGHRSLDAGRERATTTKHWHPRATRNATSPQHCVTLGQVYRAAHNLAIDPYLSGPVAGCAFLSLASVEPSSLSW